MAHSRRQRRVAGRQRPPEGCTIADLPDELLGRVLSLSGRQALPALTLVCKRWRDAAYQEEAIWRHFRLDARALHSLRPPAQKRRWLEGHAALLRRVAGMVQEAELIAPRGLPRRPAVAAHAQLADLVRLLQPAALTCLTLRCAAEGADAQQAAVAAALRRLLRLEELHLELNRPPASMPKALGRLHSLRCLSLRATAIAPALVASVAQLSGLTCLGLHLMHRRHCLPGGALGALTALTGLRRLELSENADDPRDDEDEEEGAEGWPQLPPPAAFPALTLYDYQTCERSFQIAACPAARMCRCACALVYIGAARTPAWRVELGEAWVQADLQQLLDALLPRGAPADLPLVLVLDGCCLAAPACTAGCPALCHAVGLGLFNFRTQAPHFPSLHYDPANEPPERQAAGLPAVLALLPGLQALTLDASATPEDEHPSLPESVARLRGLTSLTLDGLDLDDLPPGPYLADLLSLSLPWNAFERVPPALAAATNLTSLRIDFNEGAHLEQADVDGVLLRLPRLAQLQLGYFEEGPTHAELAVLEALRAARPALRARCVPAAAAAGEQGEGGADVRGGAAGSEEQEEGSQCEGYSDSELGRGDSSSSSEEEDPEYAYKLWWREMYQASLEQYPDEGSDE